MNRDIIIFIVSILAFILIGWYIAWLLQVLGFRF